MRFVSGVGRTNIDILYSGIPRVPAEGEELYSSAFSLQLGGGIPATLITLSRLGVSGRIQSFLGGDMFSKFAQGEFEKNGVSIHNLYKGKEIPVNVTSVIVTPRDRAFISYSDPVPVGDRELAEVFDASRGAEIVMMHEDFLPIYPELKRHGSTLMYDTGWRDDMSEENMREILELADWYTPNAREAMKITGASTPEAAARGLAKYFETPVVKLDKQGCLLLEKGRAVIIPSIPGTICVDTTGAGDAFLAGFAYGLFHKAPIRQCALYGNITGGECVTGVGCLTNYVNEEELVRRAAKYADMIE